MEDYTSAHTGAQLDAAVVDLTALLSSGGLGKNLILQNDKRLQGLTVGATNRDLAYVDTSDRVHIGEGTDIIAHGKLTVSDTNTVAIPPDLGADDLVISTPGTGGITILTGGASQGNIQFGDSGDNDASRIRHNNSNNVFSIFTQGIETLELDPNQNVKVSAGDFKVSSGNFSFGSAVGLTVAGGVITPTTAFVSVDTEGATPSDNLDTINVPAVGSTGSFLIIKGASGARPVTVRNDQGNIFLAGASNFALVSSRDRLLLVAFGADWFEVSRSSN